MGDDVSASTSGVMRWKRATGRMLTVRRESSFACVTGVVTHREGLATYRGIINGDGVGLAPSASFRAIRPTLHARDAEFRLARAVPDPELAETPPD